MRPPQRKISRAVVKRNPLKNIRAMLQLNPYAAVEKKNAELFNARNLRIKRAAYAKKHGKKLPADPMAKRAAAMAKKAKKATKGKK